MKIEGLEWVKFIPPPFFNYQNDSDHFIKQNESELIRLYNTYKEFAESCYDHSD